MGAFLMRRILIALAFVVLSASAVHAQSVTVRSSVLPAGAATATKQDANTAALTSLLANVTDELVSVFYSADLDESGEDVPGTAGCLTGGVLTNRSAAEIFFKFYALPASSVTEGTTVPKDVGGFVIPVGANASTPVTGIFQTGGCWSYNNLSVAATTDFVEDGSPGAPAANMAVITLFYK